MLRYQERDVGKGFVAGSEEYDARNGASSIERAEWRR